MEIELFNKIKLCFYISKLYQYTSNITRKKKKIQVRKLIKKVKNL